MKPGPKSKGRTITLTIRLSPEERAMAESIGGGKASAGIRVALAYYADTMRHGAISDIPKLLRRQAF